MNGSFDCRICFQDTPWSDAFTKGVCFDCMEYFHPKLKKDRVKCVCGSKILMDCMFDRSGKRHRPIGFRFQGKTFECAVCFEDLGRYEMYDKHVCLKCVKPGQMHPVTQIPIKSCSCGGLSFIDCLKRTTNGEMNHDFKM